jgi:hypothetical protein
MTRVSRGWVLLVVAAVGALAAGTGLSLLFSSDDLAPPNRALKPVPATAPRASASKAKPHRRSPAAIAARVPAPQLIAQLFVVGVHGTSASRRTLQGVRRRGWGGVVLTPDNWLGPRPGRPGG